MQKGEICKLTSKSVNITPLMNAKFSTTIEDFNISAFSVERPWTSSELFSL
jgi:hypothetical protein